MSRITPKKILAEEFKDQPWIAKLLSPINEFITQNVQINNGNVTIEDNLRAEVKRIELRTSEIPLKFRCKYPERPLSLIVGYVEEISGTPAVLSSPVWAHWTWDAGVVTVQAISGLSPTSKYRINLKVDYA